MDNRSNTLLTLSTLLVLGQIQNSWAALATIEENLMIKIDSETRQGRKYENATWMQPETQSHCDECRRDDVTRNP